MGRNCLNCGYCKEVKDEYNMTGYYCNDLDCEIDPCEPICSEEYYES